MSFTITFWLGVVVLPLPSLKVQVTTVVPWAVIGKLVVVVPVMLPTQASVAVGAVGVPAFARHIRQAGHIRHGAVTSSSTTFWVGVALLPLPSL